MMDHGFASRLVATVSLPALLSASCAGALEEPRDRPVPGDEGPTPGPGGTGGRGGAPAPTVPVPEPPDPAACQAPAARLWKLTPSQYARSLTRVLPSVKRPLDELGATLAPGLGFSNDAQGGAMSEPHVAQLFEIARAAAAAADLTTLQPCLAERPISGACVRGSVTALGARAFRRELDSEEVDRYTGFVTAGGATEAAVRALITALLMSPHFLYRSELGAATMAGTARLTPSELASAISYFLTDGPPDDGLWQAARTGALSTKEQIATHARRLLGAADRAPGLVTFFDEQFQLTNVKTTDKDAKLFPSWTPALAADLSTEARLYVRGVLWSEDGRFETLLLGKTTHVNARVAAIHGLPAPAGGNTMFQEVPLPAHRAGLLTLPAVMAHLARDNDTDPVGRGRFVREEVLCQELPPVPAGLNVTPPPPDGKRSQRERLEAHSRDPGCAGCHGLMDPIGLGFEPYDAIGRHRETEVGKRIDASGVITGIDPTDARFAGPVELAGHLARSPQASRCLVQKLYQYAHGRHPGPGDACALDRLTRAFAASRGDMKELAVSLVSDDSFVTRTP